MATGKRSFLLYCDLLHTVKKLSNDEAGELFKHILMYVNDEDPQTDNRIIELSFEPIKQSLKRDLKRYESIVERNRENGKKGGRPKNPKEPKKPSGLNGNPKNPSEPKKADSDSDSDSVNDNEIEKSIPAFPVFKQYALEKDSQLDHKAIKLKFDSWVENGWVDGNGREIKNWKVKLLNTIPHLPKVKKEWISPI